jgi:hypothetical protein
MTTVLDRSRAGGKTSQGNERSIVMVELTPWMVLLH